MGTTYEFGNTCTKQNIIVQLKHELRNERDKTTALIKHISGLQWSTIERPGETECTPLTNTIGESATNECGYRSSCTDETREENE